MHTRTCWLGLALAGLWAGSAGATNAVVTNCSGESDFATQLATVDGSGGGTVSFNCGTATITFTTSNNKNISSAVTIDGGGKITLDGATYYSMIQVYINANATLKNLRLTQGGNSLGFLALENHGTLTLDHVVLQSNAGSASTVVNYGTLTVRSSTFVNNSAVGATTDGGAIYHTGYGLNVSGSTFDGNSAGRFGAAIFATMPFTVLNSTFNNNTAASGGGAIYDTSGSASTILYSTIVGNNATFGAGLYSAGDGGGTPTLSIGKSIVSANTTGNCAGVLASSGYNLSDDGYCGSAFVGTGDLINQTLSMGALANNGGPTKTMLPAAGNPAIDHIPVAQCAPPVDQRGGGRPSGAGCDSGAVEVGATALDTVFYDGFD